MRRGCFHEECGSTGLGLFLRIGLSVGKTGKQGGTENLAENHVPSNIHVFSGPLERFSREEDDGIMVGPSIWDHQGGGQHTPELVEHHTS